MNGLVTSLGQLRLFQVGDCLRMQRLVVSALSVVNGTLLVLILVYSLSVDMQKGLATLTHVFAHLIILCQLSLLKLIFLSCVRVLLTWLLVSAVKM